MRAKKATLNSVVMLLNVLVMSIFGLVVPRMILRHFGSDYNGIIISITQFAGYVTLLAAGVDGATRAALYKPLAEHDTLKISGIMWATENFFRKIAIIYGGILFGIAVFYPFLVSDNFVWPFVFSLTLILGIETFVLYFFGATYQTLLAADQRAYIGIVVRTCVTILNIGVVAFLISAGYDIRIVMIASAITFMLHPFFLYVYVRKRYALSSIAQSDNSALKQRWDAFAHQFAYFIKLNVGAIVATVFLGIMEASVYLVYIMIIRLVRVLVQSIAGASIEAPFGEMLAKKEHKALQGGIKLNEFLINSASTLLLVCTALLIVPFVTVYTTGVYDVNYYRPLFAFIACAAEFAFVARLPLSSVVNAAGHFRQTRNGAIVEVVINIVLSVILVQFFGLVGVALGSLCAMLFRTVQMSLYASNHIVKRSFMVFVRKLVLSLATAAIIIALASLLPEMAEVSYLSWILHALPVFGIALGVTGLFAVLFYREELVMLWKLVRKVVGFSSS